MANVAGKLSKPSVFLISEFVVIVLGVLVALAVDSWNSSRQDERTRAFLVESLLSDLREDAEDYKEFVDVSGRRSAAANLVQQLADAGPERSDKQAGLAKEALYLLGASPRLETVDSTFREMSALGSGATMHDRDLRLKISYYYGLARDRADVNDLLAPGILRYRASLEDIGISFVDRQAIDVGAVMEYKKTLAIVRELGRTADAAVRLAADLQQANANLIARLEAMAAG